MSFYSETAVFYDEMTELKKRMVREKPLWLNILSKYPAKNILDAGCGSGFLAYVLAEAVDRMVGIDPEKAMIELAQKNNPYPEKVKFETSGIDSAAKNYPGGFEAVFMVGNTFPHFLSADEQFQAVVNMKQMIKNDGYIFLQMVNYARIKRFDDYILSTKSTDLNLIERIYNTKEPFIEFKIRVSEHTNPKNYKEIINLLYPIRSEELISLARQAGFGNIQLYGSLNLDPYMPEKSDNLLAVLKI
ncbi:MAG: class I SAM-dependent methyltransferase [Calditrichaceae bacterium]